MSALPAQANVVTPKAPAAAIARCGEVLAAWASPPGLEYATPAKLWPATPMLDSCRLPSPMVLASTRGRDPHCPEVLLLSPPGLEEPLHASAQIRPPGILEEVGVIKRPMEPMHAPVQAVPPGNLEKAATSKRPIEQAKPPGKLEKAVASKRPTEQAKPPGKLEKTGASKRPTENSLGAPAPVAAATKVDRSAKGSNKKMKNSSGIHSVAAPRPVGRQHPVVESKPAGVANKSNKAAESEKKQAKPAFDADAADLCELPQVMSIPEGGSPCALCDEIVLSLPEDAAEAQHCYMDGRLVCAPCRAIFDPSGFVPRYHVCINPLCRRKWKQLTPKVLPFFCPPCKRQLEEGILETQHSLETGPAEQMYQRWYTIFVEMAEALGFAEPPERLSGGSSTEPHPSSSQRPRPADSEEARDRWRHLLAAFTLSFPPAPPSEDVRNWNSVHGRKLYYRGIVRKARRHFVCIVEAQAEIGEDLTTTKRIPTGNREFHLLDWQEHLADGEEVLFIAFPNPSVTERDRVSRIVRLVAPSLPPTGNDLTSAAIVSNPIVVGDVEKTVTSEKRRPQRLNTQHLASMSDSPQAQKSSSCPATFAATSISAGEPDPPISVVAAESDVQPTPPQTKADRKRIDSGHSLCSLSADEEATPPAGSVISPSSAFADFAFADLMQWSQDCPETENPTANGSRRTDISARASRQMPSETVQEASMPSRPPSGNRPPLLPPSPSSAPQGSPGITFSSPPLLPRGSPKVPHSNALPGAPVGPGTKMAGRGKQSPQTPMYLAANGLPVRSPLIAPRSPFAAYFDD